MTPARLARAGLASLLLALASCSNPFGSDCVAIGVAGITTYATDAVTKTAVTSDVTVRLTDGAYLEVLTYPFPGSNPPRYAGALERPGRYDVRVEAAGYEPVVRTNVSVRRGGSCNAIRPVSLNVELARLR